MFHEAVRVRPELVVDAHRNLGSILQKLNRLDEAEAAYREVVRLRPDHASSHVDLGSLLQKRGKLPEAEAALREALRLKPEDHVVRDRLVDVLAAGEQAEEAIVELRLAVLLKPDHAQDYARLGRALSAQRQFSEAAAAYRESIRIEPGKVEWFIELASLAEKTQGLEASLAILDDAADRNPGSAAESTTTGAMSWSGANGRSRRSPTTSRRSSSKGTSPSRMRAQICRGCYPDWNRERPHCRRPASGSGCDRPIPSRNRPWIAWTDERNVATRDSPKIRSHIESPGNLEAVSH